MKTLRLCRVLCSAAAAVIFAVSSTALAAETDAEKAQPESAAAEAPSDDSAVIERFADEGRVFAPLAADPREAQLKLGYLHTIGDDSFFDLTLGGDADLAYWKGPGERRTSLSVRGLISARFAFNSDSFDMQNVDFQGGLALGTARGGRSYEAYLFHQSSHLGDELVDSGRRERIDYSQNSLRLLAAQSWGSVRAYCGPTINFYNEPDEYDNDFQFQIGAEKRFTGWGRPMYLAVDVQAKEGLDWHPGAAVEAGVELGDPKVTKNRQRVFAQLFTGHSSMGQFYNESESYVFFGVAYNPI